jgi:demethylsterigmatocystin 6-O-methyltransferase
MDYTQLATSLEALAKSDNTQSLTADGPTRARLVAAARAVSLKFEVPFETYFRLVFSDMAVGLVSAACELGIWKAIVAKAPGSVTVTELAKELGILEITLARLLRFAATNYTIDEVGEDTYKANNITNYFTASRAENVVYLA